jgi:hypothetical protein
MSTGQSPGSANSALYAIRVRWIASFFSGEVEREVGDQRHLLR